MDRFASLIAAAIAAGAVKQILQSFSRYIVAPPYYGLIYSKNEFSHIERAWTSSQNSWNK